MSRREVERIEKDIYIKCDFCDNEYRGGTIGLGWRIHNCQLCGKDFCNCHGKGFTEVPEDGDRYHSDFDICQDCIPKFEPIWEQAICEAERHEDIRDVVKRIIQEEQT